MLNNDFFSESPSLKLFIFVGHHLGQDSEWLNRARFLCLAFSSSTLPSLGVVADAVFQKT
jgi:hypothetical protein